MVNPLKIVLEDVNAALVILTVTAELPDAGRTFEVAAIWKKPVGLRKESSVRVTWGSIGGTSCTDAKLCGEAIIRASNEIEKLSAETGARL